MHTNVRRLSKERVVFPYSGHQNDDNQSSTVWQIKEKYLLIVFLSYNRVRQS